MKKIILIGLFISLIPTLVFAQVEDPGADPDDSHVPINDYLWVLIAIGLVYVFFKFRSSLLQGSKSNKD